MCPPDIGREAVERCIVLRIQRHTADGDALVTVLDGTGRFTIDGEAHLVSAGESIIMPAHVPHAVYGQTRFKMLLTVVFPRN